MNRKVSVIVPVYNCEEYIQECLNSIINQSYENLEIIVINDGSKDNSDKIIKDICKEDERIKYIFQKNMGPSTARNNGIKNALGEYLVFIDADDNVDKEYIEKLLINVEEKNADLVCCGYIEKSVYGNNELNDFYKDKNRLSKKQFISKVCCGLGGTLWGKIFKTEIIKKNNILMNSDIYMCEDLLFVLEYCKYGETFYAIKDKLYMYNRLNEKSITSIITKEYLDNNIKVYNILEDLLNELGLEYKKIYEILKKRYEGLTKAIIKSEVKSVGSYTEYLLYKNNLRLILNKSDIRKFKKNFSNKRVSEKISYILINNELYLGIYLYESLYNLCHKLKNSIRGIKI